MTVTILRSALADAVAHVRASIPYEAVGLFAGPALLPGAPCPADTDGDGGCGRHHCPTCGHPAARRVLGRRVDGAFCADDEVHLDRWLPLRNASEFPRVRYEVLPTELLAAHEALEAESRYPWVVVHSHVGPATSTTPSPEDVEFARNPRQLHLILWVSLGSPTFQLWRLDPETHGPARVVRKRWRVVDQPRQAIPPTDLTRDVTGA